MAWITLDADNVVTRLSGPESLALTTAALKPGQSNPLPEIVSQTVREVRGRCAAGGIACAEGETIPDELEKAALNIIRWELITRLPAMKALADVAREKAYNEALDLLKDVANKKFFVVAPPTEEVAEEQATSPGPKFFGRPKVFGRQGPGLL